MGNPFTDESRDTRLSLDVDLTGSGQPTKLRAPESIARVVALKPKDRSIGTHALKAMLDAHLIERIVASDYDAVQRTLGTLFGHGGPPGPASDTRHRAGS